MKRIEREGGEKRGREKIIKELGGGGRSDNRKTKRLHWFNFGLHLEEETEGKVYMGLT